MDRSIIDIPSDLDFQRFEGNGGYHPSTEHENENAVGRESEENKDVPSPKSASPWHMDFYKKLFDVDTEEVVERIKWSFLPHGNFLQNYVKNKPDLYGPFWICITLVFSTAITGNIADYFHTSLGDSYHWKYDFHTVTTVATVIFLYAWFLPCLVWALVRWYGSQHEKLNLIEIISLYGYCLFIFVPLSALWLIPKPWFQWIITISGATASGLVLTKSMFPVFTKKIYPVLALLLVLHIYIASMFMLKFVKVSTVYPTEASVIQASTSTPAAVVLSSSSV